MNLRKFSLVFALAFLSNPRNMFKGYIGILALFIQRHVSHYKKPYIDPRINTLDILGSFASICTLFGGIVFFTDATLDQTLTLRSTFDYLRLFLFSLVLLINLAFWGSWLYHFFSVLIRLHFKRFKKFCKRHLKIKINRKIDSYEADLRRVL